METEVFTGQEMSWVLLGGKRTPSMRRAFFREIPLNLGDISAVQVLDASLLTRETIAGSRTGRSKRRGDACADQRSENDVYMENVMWERRCLNEL